MSLHNGVDYVAVTSFGVYTETYGAADTKEIANLFASLGYIEDAPELAAVLTETVRNNYIEITGFNGTDWSYSARIGTDPLKVHGIKLIPSASGQKVVVRADTADGPIVGTLYAPSDAEPRLDVGFANAFLPYIDGTASVLNATSKVIIFGSSRR